MSKATAAVLRQHDAPFVIEEIDVGEPRADEVLVRLVSVGVCHTDLLARDLPAGLFRGPVVFGHEGAGVVERVGSAVTKVAPGDHVVLSFHGCGKCTACDTGHPAYCPRFARINTAAARADGSTAFTDAAGAPVGSHYFGQSSFASLTVATQDSVVRVDPQADLTKIGPLGCGFQTGAGAILNVFDVKPGQSVTIAGAGAVGLAAVMAAKSVGADPIIAIDRHDNRLAVASKYGATETLNVPMGELTAAIKQCTGGTGSDYALDLTGHAGIIRAIFDGLGHTGMLGLCGGGFGEVTFDMSKLISGRRIQAVIEGDAVPDQFIPQLLALNAAGKFPFEELIETYPHSQINTAVRDSLDGRVIKPVLLFD